MKDEWTIKVAEDDLGEHTLILLNGSVEATLDGTGWITPMQTATLREQLAAAQAENERLKAALKVYAPLIDFESGVSLEDAIEAERLALLEIYGINGSENAAGEGE